MGFGFAECIIWNLSSDLKKRAKWQLNRRVCI
jgi:hypothetical protein